MQKTMSAKDGSAFGGKISKIQAKEILAASGNPSVEVSVTLDDGSVGTASVSYGVSAGTKEAFVLFDKDKSRFNGKGMLKAVSNVNEIIAPELLGKNSLEQREIDMEMIKLDGTENKSNLGANAILGVSMAVARVASVVQKLPLYRHLSRVYGISNEKGKLSLPKPMVVMIEGGAHADNSTDFQEYLISIVKDEGPRENIRVEMEIYQALKIVLKKNGYSVNVGNEGAFAPEGMDNNEKPLEYLVEAIGKAGYKPEKDASISIDPASSEFYKDGKYELKAENKVLSAEELIEKYKTWFSKYPIVTLEDGLSEFDWENWPKLVSIAGNIPIIGDDLTVTNTRLLQKAIDEKAITSILIKLNQAGTVTETIDTCLLARKYGMMTVPSHRGGGETNDTFLVDLAVAVGSEYIKVGPTRGERVVKYNRLMEIEEELN